MRRTLMGSQLVFTWARRHLCQAGPQQEYKRGWSPKSCSRLCDTREGRAHAVPLEWCFPLRNSSLWKEHSCVAFANVCFFFCCLLVEPNLFLCIRGRVLSNRQTFAENNSLTRLCSLLQLSPGLDFFSVWSKFEFPWKAYHLYFFGSFTGSERQGFSK